MSETNKPTGVELIAKERAEQIYKHKITVEDDCEHNQNEQLAAGAAAILTDGDSRWPLSWDTDRCARMLEKNYQGRLITAGALIAAELDRLIHEERGGQAHG